jgi:hypothetical protein
MRQRSDGVTLVALYHFISGALSLLVMCAILSIPFIIGVSAAASYDPDAGTATVIVGILGLLFGGLFVLIAIANFVVGWGLWHQREWARISAMGLAILRLINFPLGTIIGGAIIIYMLQEHVRAEFEIES